MERDHTRVRAAGRKRLADASREIVEALGREAWKARARALRAGGEKVEVIAELVGRARSTVWAALDPEGARAAGRRWRAKNRERQIAMSRDWLERNPDAAKAQQARYRRKRSAQEAWRAVSGPTGTKEEEAGRAVSGPTGT